MTLRMPRHQLTDAQWSLIADLFPTGNCRTGRRPRDRREIVNAIFWVLRTGAPWRDLPDDREQVLKSAVLLKELADAGVVLARTSRWLATATDGLLHL